MTALAIAVLQDRSVGPVRYALRVWPIALAPTLCIAIAASFIAHAVGAEFLFDEGQWSGLLDLPGWLMLLQVVLVAPILETLLMAPLLALLMRLFRRRRRWAILGSALVWAVLHGMSAPIWGVCIFWTFVVFSTVFLIWREVSFWHAVGVTAAVHALNNAAAGAGMLLS